MESLSLYKALRLAATLSQSEVASDKQRLDSVLKAVALAEQQATGSAEVLVPWPVEGGQAPGIRGPGGADAWRAEEQRVFEPQ
jgi:hypothetical protein